MCSVLNYYLQKKNVKSRKHIQDENYIISKFFLTYHIPAIFCLNIFLTIHIFTSIFCLQVIYNYPFRHFNLRNAKIFLSYKFKQYSKARG